MFYFDELHPTRAVHGIIGAFTEATVRADHVLLRGGADDVIRASGQADLIFSGTGEDRVSGNDGSDVIFAGLGNDRIDGGSGNNLVAGGGGDDVVRSRTGIDLLAGNAGNDRLFGGTGSDVLIGGSGADQLFGESGNDVFYFEDDGIANGATVVDGGSGADTLRLIVSSALFASSEFQAELQSYRDAIAASPGAAFTFASLDLSVQSVERLETRVGNKTVFANGHSAVAQSATMTPLIHDADLWGLL